jgi:hypothetical protein
VEVGECVLEWEDNIKMDLNEMSFEGMMAAVTGFRLLTLAVTNFQS